MRFFILLSLSAGMALTACDSAPASSRQAQQTDVVASGAALPSITRSLMDSLYQNATQIDIIFYNKNISVSMDKQESIRSFLGTVSVTSATRVPDCPAQGRIFFQINGETILEADLHLIEGKCAYFVFHQNGKPMYANMISEQGIRLFKTYLENARTIGNQ